MLAKDTCTCPYNARPTLAAVWGAITQNIFNIIKKEEGWQGAEKG